VILMQIGFGVRKDDIGSVFLVQLK
jgi:hypothetical protein